MTFALGMHIAALMVSFLGAVITYDMKKQEARYHEHEVEHTCPQESQSDDRS